MRVAGAVLLLVAGACACAPVYAQLTGIDPFRTHPLLVLPGVGPVLAEAAGGLGVVPIGPGLRAYPLGADGLGRDVLARLLYGGRTSLTMAAAASALCLLLGTGAGVLAGAVRGSVDTVLSAGLDLLWAFPVTLLAISLALVLGAGPLALGPLVLPPGTLLVPTAILGVVFVPYVARPVRAALLAQHASPAIEAARATGGSPRHILWRHMLPGLLPLLAGLAPVVAAGVLLTEAALSVIGLGVPVPGASWGTLIADGTGLLQQRPLVAVAPGVAIATTVLCLNALAERVVAGAGGR